MRLRFLTIVDILRQRTPTWLVDQIIPERSRIILFGPSGIGKSFVALDLALALTHTGTEFLERRTQGGPVIYVAAEGLYTLKSREHAWLRAHKQTASADTPLVHVGEAIQLHHEASVDRFITAAQRYEPILIIFDTLARCSVGVDEIKTQEMGTVIAGVDRILAECNSAVMLVHHSQLLTGDYADRTDLLRPRGAGALNAAADTSLRLTGTRDNLLLECTKQKNAAECKPIRLWLKETEGSAVVQRQRMSVRPRKNDD